MARVTVEDCVIKVPNRFELVLLAAQRAREITSGAPLSIDRDDDKNPVVALREIAEETVGLAPLRESVVRGMQKHVELDEAEEAQEAEVDSSVFGFGAPGAALGLADARAEGEGYDDVDTAEDAEIEEGEAADEEELIDVEDDLDLKLTADELSGEDETGDSDLEELPEGDLPGEDEAL